MANKVVSVVVAAVVVLAVTGSAAATSTFFWWANPGCSNSDYNRIGAGMCWTFPRQAQVYGYAFNFDGSRTATLYTGEGCSGSTYLISQQVGTTCSWNGNYKSVWVNE